jgi:hypothetical protein
VCGAWECAFSAQIAKNDFLPAYKIFEMSPEKMASLIHELQVHQI